MENTQIYASLFKNNHAVMLLIEPQTGIIVDANPAACKFYGYSLEEMTARKITDINTFTPEEVFAEMELARSQSRNHFFFCHRLANGELRDVEVFSGPVVVSGRNLLYSIIHDITDRVRIEKLRVRDLEHLQTLLAASEQVMEAVTLEDVLQYTADAARSLVNASISTAFYVPQDGNLRLVTSASEDFPLPLELHVMLRARFEDYLLNLVADQASVSLNAEQLRKHPFGRALPPGHPWENGLLAVRLHSRDGQAAGLLMLSCRETYTFTAEDEAFLIQLSALASLRLQHIWASSEAETKAEELNTIINAMAEAVAIYNPQGRLVRVNPAMANALGGRPTGDHFTDLLHRLAIRHTDGQPASGEDLPSSRALRGETVRNIPLMFTDAWGRDLSILASGAPLYYRGQMMGAVVVFHDVTELKLVKNALLQSESRLQRLVEANIIGVMYANEAGEVTGANDAFLQMVGYTQKDLEAGLVSWGKMTPQEYEAVDQHVVSEIKKNGACAPLEKEYIRKDGSRVPVLFGVAQLEDRKEFVCFIVDLTDLKRAQEALRNYAMQLERANRELQDFAFISSHDLQEPLRKIQSFSGRLIAKYEHVLDETGQDYLLRMQSAASRMQLMISDLLSYSRVGTQGHPFVQIDLNRLVQDVISDLDLRIERSGGKVEVVDLPLIEADLTQMRQLFLNLIGNALKFHKPDVPPLVKIYSQPANPGEIEVLVEDNGIGIDPQYGERIFQPFQRLHGRSEYEGTGIGLAICRKIVERHGGSISVRSTPGVGTVFSIVLPLHQKVGPPI